jgi:hypothetical protein
MLDPPAFTPENGRELREGDRDQDLTYASSAQLPELPQRDAFEWLGLEDSRLRYAYGQQVPLVVVNKGQDSAGFAVCELCGAAWLDEDAPGGSSHRRPFLVPRKILAQEGATATCSGSLRRGLYLGHQFLTDILLLRISMSHPIDFSPGHPWLYDALATVSEAFALAATLTLDIDPGELSAGFRLLPGQTEARGNVEIFLYDTASGGAGYAAEAGEDLQTVLSRTEKLLSSCPAQCERSCTSCLRHYGNRFLHSRLDRRLGLELLRYGRLGEVPPIVDEHSQKSVLEPFKDFLELSGWRSVAMPGFPLVVEPPAPGAGHTVSIGVFPSLLAADAARKEHYVSRAKCPVLLRDYVVQRDLPTAFQTVLRASGM